MPKKIIVREPRSRDWKKPQGKITVNLPAVQGGQMAVGQWLLGTGREPNAWEVKRGTRILDNWDSVIHGETVTLKPAKKKRRSHVQT